MGIIAAEPCEECPLDAARAVASRGPVPARLVLLSGAPRYHEEREGVAFASPAFGRLEEMLAAADIDPADIHFATLTGCRPPHQRPVRMAEIAACRPRLDRAIDAVLAEVVVLCGRDAVEAMLPGVALSIGHGRLVQRGRRRYYPIRHPYAALHYEPYIQEVAADLRRLGALLAGANLAAETSLEEPAQAQTAPLPAVTGAAAVVADAAIASAPPRSDPAAAAAQATSAGSIMVSAPPGEQETETAVPPAADSAEATGPAQLSLF